MYLLTLPRLIEKCLMPKWHSKKLELAGLLALLALALESNVSTLIKWMVGCVHEVTYSPCTAVVMGGSGPLPKPAPRSAFDLRAWRELRRRRLRLL